MRDIGYTFPLLEGLLTFADKFEEWTLTCRPFSSLNDSTQCAERAKNGREGSEEWGKGRAQGDEGGEKKEGACPHRRPGLHPSK